MRIDWTLAPEQDAVKRMPSGASGVVAAYEGLGENLELLTAVAVLNANRFEHLPPDDFFAQKTSGLREPLQLFLEDYVDSSEPSLHQAVPISTPGSRQTLLPWAATAAGLLFQLGHEHVGIAVVDSTGRGVVFRYTGREDVVARELVQLRLEGAAS